MFGNSPCSENTVFGPRSLCSESSGAQCRAECVFGRLCSAFGEFSVRCIGYATVFGGHLRRHRCQAAESAAAFSRVQQAFERLRRTKSAPRTTE